MAKTLTYQPASRWPVFAALVAALTLEFTALGVAGLRRTEQIPTDVGFQTPAPIQAEFIATPPDPTPPDELPPPLPPPSQADSEFVIVEPTPPPQVTWRTRPQVASASHAVRANSGPTTPLSAQASLTNAPRPAYPYEARRAHQTGSGSFLLRFDPGGGVVAVTVDRSTGSALLDQVAESTFRRWRSKPGTCRAIRVAVTFTLQGAQM